MLNLLTSCINQNPLAPVLNEIKDNIDHYPFQIKKTACLGDSLTYVSGGYPSYLEELCPKIKFDNFGIGGNTPESMYVRLREYNTDFEKKIIGLHDYDCIIILGGTNGHTNVQMVIQSLIYIYAKCKQNKLLVIACTIPPLGRSIGETSRTLECVNQINRWILSKPYNVDIVVDLYSALVVNGIDFNYNLTFDGEHPNIEGSKFIAKIFYDNIFSKL